MKKNKLTTIRGRNRKRSVTVSLQTINDIRQAQLEMPKKLNTQDLILSISLLVVQAAKLAQSSIRKPLYDVFNHTITVKNDKDVNIEFVISFNSKDDGPVTEVTKPSDDINYGDYIIVIQQLQKLTAKKESISERQVLNMIENHFDSVFDYPDTRSHEVETMNDEDQLQYKLN